MDAKEIESVILIFSEEPKPKEDEKIETKKQSSFFAKEIFGVDKDVWGKRRRGIGQIGSVLLDKGEAGDFSVQKDKAHL